MFTLDLGNLLVHLGLDSKTFSKDVAGAVVKIQQSSQKMIGVGNTLMRRVTAPILAVGAASVKSSVSIESAFAGVRKTVDATKGEFADLQRQFRDLSTEIPVPLKQLYGIGEAAGQLGIRKEYLTSFTKTMAQLGDTTDLAAQDAAMALARIANIMKTPQTEFDRMGSTIVDLGNNLATTESEIVALATRMAATGKIVGMSEAQVFALAGAFSSVGMEAEAGGTAVSKILMDMMRAVSKGGNELKTFAGIAGMSAETFAKRFKEDAAGALVEFVNGLGRMQESGGDVLAVLDALGMENIRVSRALLSSATAGDLLNRSLEIGTKAWAENVALANEANKRYETSAARFRLVWNRIVILADTIGGPLTKRLLSLSDKYLVPLIKHVDSWSAATKGLITDLALLTAAIGPVVWSVGTLVHSLTTMIITLTTAITATNLLSAALYGIVTAAAAARFGKYLYQEFESVAKIATIAAGTIKIVWEDIKFAANTAVYGIKSVWGGLRKWFLNFAADMMLEVSNVLIKAEELAGKVTGNVVSYGSAETQMMAIDLRAAATKGLEGVEDEYMKMAKEYSTTVTTLAKATAQAVQEIHDKFRAPTTPKVRTPNVPKGIGEDAVKSIKEAAEAAREAMAGITAPLSEAEQTMTDMLAALDEEKEIVNLINEGYERGADIIAFQKAAMVAYAGDVDKVTEAVEKYKQKLKEVGEVQQNIYPTFFAGVKAGFEDMNRQLGNFGKLGFQVSQEFTEGLGQAVVDLTDESNNLSDVMKGLLRDIANMILKWAVMKSITSAASALNIPIPAFHKGGVPGAGEATGFRLLQPDTFKNAPRAHTGLGPDERPVIVDRREGIFTPAQMEAMGRGDSQSGGLTDSLLEEMIGILKDRQVMQATIVDHRDLVTSDDFSGRKGERIVMNHVNRNRDTRG